MTLELCAHTSSHHSRPPRTECDKTTHLSYCCSLALAHHCQTVSVLGLLIPHPWPLGEAPDTAGFHSHPALLSAGLWCPSKPHQGLNQQGLATANIPPLQNCSKCWHCRESFQKSTFYPCSGYRKAPVTQPQSQGCDAGSAFQPPADLGSLPFSSLLPRPENAGHGFFWSGLITDKSSKSILGTPDPETDTKTIKEPKQMEVSLKSNKK